MKDMSEKTGMLIARITVLVIALIGVFIARNPDSSVFQIVSFAWAGFGASFGPLVLLALFWNAPHSRVLSAEWSAAALWYLYGNS